MNLDVTSNKLVYLCYRYKQVDQYIGEKTISEAKRCHRRGIDIDTVMISEDDPYSDTLMIWKWLLKEDPIILTLTP